MRIAFGGYHIECSNYNPLFTRQEDFRIYRGPDLTAAPAFAFLKEFDAQFLPIFHARAVPGAPVSRDTYESFKREFLAGLAALGPIDGVYLALHGASFVEGMEDAEGDFITAVRAAVGPDMPITASYDLHGNVSQAIVDGLDMYSAYRTAPHIDVEQTMRRAVALLVKSLTTGVRPAILWCPIPVMFPGEKTMTTDEPGKGLYARLPEIDAIEGIWDASLMVGYAWADERRVTAAAILTGTDRPAMEKAAKALAQAYWDAREKFAFGPQVGSISEGIKWAMESETAPVILADSGDNPTAGGAGDRAEMLGELIKANARGVILAGIADRPATEAAFAAGLGAPITTMVGASLHKDGSIPVPVTGIVQFLSDPSTAPEREAVIRIGGIDLVVSARRRPYHDIADFSRLDLDPHAAKILVVKSGYLSPELAPIANPPIMVLSPGIVDQSIERLPRTRTPRPMYPFDRDFSYEPKAIWSARAKG